MGRLGSDGFWVGDYGGSPSPQRRRIYSKQKVMNEEDDDEGYSRHKSERKGCIIKAKPSTRCTLSAAGQRQERSFEAYAGERGKAGNSSEVR